MQHILLGLILVALFAPPLNAGDVYESKCGGAGSELYNQMTGCRQLTATVVKDQGVTYTKLTSKDYEYGGPWMMVRGNHVKSIIRAAKRFRKKYGSYNVAVYYDFNVGDVAGWCVYVNWDR